MVSVTVVDIRSLQTLLITISIEVLGSVPFVVSPYSIKRMMDIYIILFLIGYNDEYIHHNIKAESARRDQRTDTHPA